MIRLFLGWWLGLLLPLGVQAQTAAAVDHWHQALNYYKAQDFEQAMSAFRQFNALQGNHPHTLSYLGDCYYNLQQLDSALHYYQSALALEPSPLTTALCHSKITRCYLQQGDFKQAYATAYTNLSRNPESQRYQLDLRDVCLWAYLTKHNRLDKKYLTRYHLQNAYIVNSVAAQKIIARNVRGARGEQFIFDNTKNVGYAEHWYGYFEGHKTEEKKLYFLFTDTNYDRALQQQEEKALKLVQDTHLPIYERLGALYFLAPLNDKKMKILLDLEELPIRFCACHEMRPYIHRRYKRICQEDKNPDVQAAVLQNDAYQP